MRFIRRENRSMVCNKRSKKIEVLEVFQELANQKLQKRLTR